MNQPGFLGTSQESVNQLLEPLNLYYAIPIASMYGIFTYIYHKNQLNVGKYTIHGSYGICLSNSNKPFFDKVS